MDNVEGANVLLNGCKVRFLGGLSSITGLYNLHFKAHYHKDREGLQL